MRKTEIVTATEGRDAGRKYLITEWDAARADRWATRAVLALAGGSTPLPFPVQALVGKGMEAIFVVGLQTILTANINPDVLLPLLDELLTCVKIIRDPKALDKDTGQPLAFEMALSDDIQEVKTRWWLRSEVLRIHTGFSAGDAFSRLLTLILTKPFEGSETTPTSAEKSAP